MRRSTFIALVVGALGGLGVQLALAQPVDPTNPKVRNLTVTNSASVGNDLSVGDDLTVTDVAKVAVLDAGVALINGQLQVLGPTHLTGTSALNLTSSASRITWTSAGRYIDSDESTGDLRLNSFGLKMTNRVMSPTAPTVTACSGGTPASITTHNGTAAFVFDVGTSCTGESTAVITLPASANGWICSCSSTTADRVLQQKVIPPANTTTVTIQNIVMSTGANGDFTDGADVGCICHGD